MERQISKYPIIRRDSTRKIRAMMSLFSSIQKTVMSEA